MSRGTQSRSAYPGRRALSDPRAQYDFTGVVKEMTPDGPQVVPIHRLFHLNPSQQRCADQNGHPHDDIDLVYWERLNEELHGGVPETSDSEPGESRTSESHKWIPISGDRRRKMWYVCLAYNRFPCADSSDTGDGFFRYFRSIAAAHWGVLICPAETALAGVDRFSPLPPECSVRIFGINFTDRKRKSIMLEDVVMGTHYHLNVSLHTD